MNKSAKFLSFIASLFVFSFVFVKLSTITHAAYPSGCNACRTAGAWCVEPGTGYGCQPNGNLCGASLGQDNTDCPAGCNCTAYAYIGGNTSCANACLHIDSCAGSPPPPAPNPPPPPGGGSCPCSLWCNPSCPGGYTQTNYCGGSCSSGTVACIDNNQCGGGPPPQPPPPPPAATCSLNPNFAPASPINAGTSTTFRSNITINNGSLSTVTVTSLQPAIATVSGSGVNRTVTGQKGGVATIRVSATVNGAGGSGSCGPVNRILTVNQVAWWQVKDGDVVARGNLTSRIPLACNAAVGCNPAFNLKGPGGFPGLPIYSGATYDFADSTASLGIPAEGTIPWISQSNYASGVNNYSYASFVRQLPPSILAGMTTLASGNIDASTFAGASDTDYSWYKVVGNAIVTGDIVITGSKKVILLVEGGNLTVNGKIDIQSPGSGFFMTLVGKDASNNRGNLTVNAGNAAAATTATLLEGVFFAEGTVSSGTRGTRNDSAFKIRGSVASLTGVSLLRDLGDVGNINTAGDTVEYAPEISMMIPKELLRDRVTWQEVAP